MSDDLSPTVRAILLVKAETLHDMAADFIDVGMGVAADLCIEKAAALEAEARA